MASKLESFALELALELLLELEFMFTSAFFLFEFCAESTGSQVLANFT